MKLCIIGGGGGASNAANVIRRLNKEAEIQIFTNRGEIGNLPCEIPFVLSGSLPTWESSFAFRDKFYRERSIEVHFNTEVTGIIPDEKRLMAGGESYSYDKAILDLGSIYVTPPIPGLDGQREFILSTGLEPARIFEEAIPKYQSAAILGVGQIALEVASILVSKGYSQVYLVGRSEHILRTYLDSDMAEIFEQRIRESNIELILNSKVASISTREGTKLISLPGKDLNVDFVFIATGARPNAEMAERSGISVGETGAIAVNDYLQTSDPDIYAIGDCMENRDLITGRKIRYQTATNAARSGRIAGRNAVLGNVIRYHGTVMPFVMENFGYQVGTVGLTEALAQELGFNVVTNITTTSTRRRSFGGKPAHIKLIADADNLVIIGAQIISEELVAGKIDRLAVAIAEKIPLERIALIDTCYSPTTGAGYEAVTMALDQLMERLAGS